MRLHPHRAFTVNSDFKPLSPRGQVLTPITPLNGLKKRTTAPKSEIQALCEAADLLYRAALVNEQINPYEDLGQARRLKIVAKGYYKQAIEIMEGAGLMPPRKVKERTA